jgi:hypothetical protein
MTPEFGDLLRAAWRAIKIKSTAPCPVCANSRTADSDTAGNGKDRILALTTKP